MKAVIDWQGDVCFQAQTGSGHSVTIDGPAANGGADQGPRPMEMMLAGSGSCAAQNVVLILKKARQAISHCRCELSAERADGVPAVFTAIHLHFVISGHDLKPAQVAKAIQLTADKYCAALAMLSNADVAISHDYEVHETAGE